jgi:pimeloyl-ACP methyl ester carboxylesterase
MLPSGVKDKIRFSRIPTNGVTLHLAEAGPSDGPLVFLLHGFPEFWYGWRNQIAPLAERGFHVVAPDQRGYNLSDKPKGVDNYDLDLLAGDIVGLADHFGQERFALIGHDWGAAIGWWLAGQHADRLRGLAALNAPHPAVWLEAVRTDPVQRKKSAYVRLFQIPYLPEILIGLNLSKTLAKVFGDSIRPDAFTKLDLEEYRKAWNQPGALTGALNYYRAASRKLLLPATEYRVRCPTLIIWGRRDAYAIPELAEWSLRLCVEGRIEFFDQSSHWVQHDEPQPVTSLLAEFLAGEAAR